MNSLGNLSIHYLDKFENVYVLFILKNRIKPIYLFVIISLSIHLFNSFFRYKSFFNKSVIIIKVGNIKSKT